MLTKVSCKTNLVNLAAKRIQHAGKYFKVVIKRNYTYAAPFYKPEINVAYGRNIY